MDDITNWPFRKVLIANRGEIAVRVIRACRELGLTSVAVYSDADRNALHVRMADEAYHIGPSQASKSYLHIPTLIDVAKRSGAQAVHPGYGFLAENATFVETCIAEGLIFVGPSPEAQRAMGEKTAARRMAQSVGVPIVPGTMTDIEDDARAMEIAEQLGYPLLLKAAGGGGGKGIRFVRDPKDLLPSLRTARSEAKSAFSDSRVYIEKAIHPARHIEVQIIADTHGNVVHLGERECSIQRRHQKLVEESPSPVIDEELRERITSAAVKLIRAIDYVNAGTVECLLGPDRNFYFLEVNARIQVEHPVTELCTGIDLVQEQFRVAAGLPLSFRQEQVVFRGSAIECRISAEDPENRFLPATGTVQALQEPSGPGVRLDSGLYAGLQVPLFYDPLLSKLIVWAGDRQYAIARMRRALSEYHIMGVRTTLPFARWLMQHPRFIAGDMSTDFIAEEWNTRNTVAPTVGVSAERSEAQNQRSEAERLSILPLRQSGTSPVGAGLSRPSPIDRLADARFIASREGVEADGAYLNTEQEALPPAQVAAIIGSLLMNEETEKEKLRRRPAGDTDTERSRWRDLGWKEAVRRMS